MQVQNGLKWVMALEISFCCSAGRESIIYLQSFVPHGNFLSCNKYCVCIPPICTVQQQWSVILMHSKLCIPHQHQGLCLVLPIWGMHIIIYLLNVFSSLNYYFLTWHSQHKIINKNERKKKSGTLILFNWEEFWETKSVCGWLRCQTPAQSALSAWNRTDSSC